MRRRQLKRYVYIDGRPISGRRLDLICESELTESGTGISSAAQLIP